MKASEGLHLSTTFGGTASSAKIQALCSLLSYLYDSKRKRFVSIENLPRHREEAMRKYEKSRNNLGTTELRRMHFRYFKEIHASFILRLDGLRAYCSDEEEKLVRSTVEFLEQKMPADFVPLSPAILAPLRVNSKAY